MPDSDNYPTEDELQAILDFEGTPAEFVDYIDSLWWHRGFTVKNGRDHFRGVKRCTLSTWGWSGNEDILETITQTWFWLLWWTESRRGGHYTFEVPSKENWNTKLSIGKYGLPHSKLKADPDVIKHFDKTHFIATTIGGRQFLYCPVGNICSWSIGDVEHKFCAWCNKFFMELNIIGGQNNGK